MWVEDVPLEEVAADIQLWEANRQRHIDAGGSILYTVPPAPVRVVVKWSEAWNPSVIEKELDDETRMMQKSELRKYPDVGLDPLKLNG